MSGPYRLADADLSPCGTYRYTLWRWWEEPSVNVDALTVIGLNPSTADALQDDPTIRRCVGFAKREGCGALLMLNLFALRATDPATLRLHPNPIGPANDLALNDWIQCARDRGTPVVAAWGAHGALHGRAAAIVSRFPGLRCFGVTKDGHPRHPLYLRADTPLVPLPDSTPEAP